MLFCNDFRGLNTVSLLYVYLKIKIFKKLLKVIDVVQVAEQMLNSAFESHQTSSNRVLALHTGNSDTAFKANFNKYGGDHSSYYFRIFSVLYRYTWQIICFHDGYMSAAFLPSA